MSGINLRYINLLGSRSLDDAPKVSKCPKKCLIQLQLKMPNGEKAMKVKSDQTRSPLPLFITSHSLQHTSKLYTPAGSW